MNPVKPVSDGGQREGAIEEAPYMPLDAYEQRASECLRLAESSRTLEERTTWRELAVCWLRLSERAEEFRSRVRPLVQARTA